jgi:hypothetical protein
MPRLRFWRATVIVLDYWDRRSVRRITAFAGLDALGTAARVGFGGSDYYRFGS